MKRFLFCGSRDWTDRRPVRSAMDMLVRVHKQFLVIEGGAPGLDTLAGQIADELGLPHATMKANWPFYGRAAGPIRNRWMLDLDPDKVFAFHRDIRKSKGTKDCVDEARRRKIRVSISM